MHKLFKFISILQLPNFLILGSVGGVTAFENKLFLCALKKYINNNSGGPNYFSHWELGVQLILIKNI